MARKDMKQPAVMYDGRLVFRRAGDSAAVPPGSAYGLDESGARDALRDDLGGDLADATQADGAGRAGRQVKHPATDERAAIVDGDNDAAAAMGDPKPGAERQRTVGAGHGVLIEPLTRGGLAAGLVAIKRCDP